MSTPLEQRLFAKIGLPSGPDGCMEWLGWRTSGGYGRLMNHGRPLTAHRVAYEYWVEPIPAGLDLDHLCRNRGCCNPDHLEAVTRRTNLLRGMGSTARNAAKTHCPAGHSYDVLNTYWTRTRTRKCRQCNAARARAWRAK